MSQMCGTVAMPSVTADLCSPRFTRDADGQITPLCNTGESQADWAEAIRRAFGTDNPETIGYLTKCFETCAPKDTLALNAFFDGLADLKPRDHMERLLLTQSMIVHHKICLALARSLKTPYDNERTQLDSSAAKFIRLFCQQMEALRKYRRDGTQTVNVNHVYVDKAVITENVQTSN